MELRARHRYRGGVTTTVPEVEARLSGVDWPAVDEALRERPYATLSARLTPEAGGYNCLHQDIYGAVAFPLQLVALLSRPGRDFEGGEFLLVQQRPRAQSVAEVVRAEQGDMVVFANRHWPAVGTRGFHRASVRHGVSRVLSGVRFALGIIFHDAA